jgi:hypothetical protein
MRSAVSGSREQPETPINSAAVATTTSHWIVRIGRFIVLLQLPSGTKM